MTPEGTVVALLERGIELWSEGGGIGYRGPRGAMTPPLRDALAQHKAAILALFGRGRRYALPSFAQQRLWFLEELEPAVGRFNLQPAWRLRGTLDVPALAATLRAVARRHETLRTHFACFDGRPYQVIAARSSLSLPQIDLTALPALRRIAAARSLAASEADRSFDLGGGPLVRACLLVLRRSDDHILLITLHHAIADGWSEDVLRRDLRRLYAQERGTAVLPLPALVLSYVDYARQQRTALSDRALADHLAYWRAQLADAPILALATDRPRPVVAGYRGAVRRTTLAASQVGRLVVIGRHAGASLYMVLLATVMVLLHRFSGQGELLVGSPIAGRQRQEFEELVGLFLNNLVLRGRCGDDPRFITFLHRIRDVVLAAFAHQALPFEKLVEALMPARDLSRNPLFQVLFNLHAFPAATVEDEMPGVPAFTPFAGGRYAAGLDLTFYAVVQGGRVDCSLVYRTDLFDANTVERMLRAWTNLLRGLCAEPGRRLSALPLFDSAALHQVLVAWAGYPRKRTEVATVVQGIGAQVAHRGDAIALVQGHCALTYEGLIRRASRLARRLQRMGVGRERRVAICIERSPEMVVAVLAVLMTGGAYVPLDPAYPAARLCFLLADCGAPWLLVTEGLSPSAIADEVGQVFTVDVEAELPSDGAATLLTPGTHPDDLAYVIYTSGSTGRPKGVLATHRGVVAYLHGLLSVYALDAKDTVLQRAALGFDVSVRDLLAPLWVGARLVLPAPTAVGDPQALLQVALRQRVTCLPGMVPSLWRRLLAAMEAGGPSPRTLRLLMTGGEALPYRDVERTWQSCGPEMRMVSLYGPTECTGASMSWWVRAQYGEKGSVPLGRPLPHAWVGLFDRRLRPVPMGAVGEVCIGGEGLSRGYHRRPGQTAAAFVPHPAAIAPGARLYRSGDLGRWRSDGVLSFLGRRDHQLKVRGHRIEPAEVGEALCAHPAVCEAVVVARRLAGESELVTYWVPTQNQTVTVASLRAHLAARLPGAWMPARFELLGALPLSPHGKVDRGALPAPTVQRPVLATAFKPPRTPVEEMLAGLWCELLEVERVGVDDDFFALGGHSLLAARLAARLSQRFAVALPLRRIFETPTITTLAAEITEALRRGCGIAPQPIMPLSRRRPLPLSFAQERLWFLHRLAPTSVAYSLPAAFQVEGRLDLTAFAMAVQKVRQRHEILRTTFAVKGGRPVQVISPSPSPGPLPVVLDLSALPHQRQEGEGRRLARLEATQPFDLSRGPLFRVQLIRLQSTNIIVLNLHHIVTDGWSRGLLYHELAAGYRAFAQGRTPDLAPLELQYADFAGWQRHILSDGTVARLVDYWKERLAGLSPLALPTDRSRPLIWNDAGAEHPLRLDRTQADAQQALSRATGTTPFMTLLAVLLTLLRAHTGQHDLAVGIPVAHRPRVELEPLIGFFVNTLVLRVRRVAGTFDELLGRVRENALAAYAHLDLPFERLVEALAPERDTGRQPFFQVLFAVHNAPARALDIGGLPWRPLPLSTGAARFDLELHLWEEGETFHGTVVYSTALFDGTTINRFVQRFGTLLLAAATQPAAPLAALSCLMAAEQHQMLYAWNDSRTLHPGGFSLAAAFAAQIAQRPEAIAVVMGDSSLTYGALERLADQLAWRLDRAGTRSGHAVVLFLERSLAWAVAIVALLKHGAAMVPLDPADPPARRTRLLAEVSAAAGAGAFRVLTTRRLGVHLPTEPLAMHFVDEASEEKLGPWRSSQSIPAANLAYVVYTSGSTGRPKGVAIPRGSLANLIAWQIGRAGALRRARTLHFAALGFDVAWQEMLATWCAGGTLVLVEEAVRRDPEALLACLVRQGIERAFLPVVALTQLARVASSGAPRLPRLTQVITAGEQLLVSSEVTHFLASCGEAYLENHYGPAETHVVSAHRLVGSPRYWPRWAPIGRPIANVELRLLAADLQPVPPGTVGELCIGGASVARGYLCQPARTAERFVPDGLGESIGGRLYRSGDLARYRNDGTLIFLGRSDRQVKVRGFRVELGEVEAVLEGYPAVRTAAVVSRPDAAGNVALIAYVAAPRSIPAESLRRYLTARLPAAYLPTRFLVRRALPRLSSGKVDRSALLEASSQSSSAVSTPETFSSRVGLPLAEQLAALWEEMLDRRPSSGEDDFFALGGHSLLAIQLVDRIRRAFQVELPLRLLFEHPRLEALAKEIERARGVSRPVSPSIQRLPRAAVLPLSFGQQRLWFLHRLEPTSAAYNQPVALELEGRLDIPAVASALRTIARRHEVLRTRFATVGGQPRPVVMASSGHLPLTDLSGLPAEKRRSAGRRLAAAEAERPFDLAAGPPFRHTLLRLDARQHQLLITLHHITADGWSWSLLFDELAVLYARFARGERPRMPPLPIQYADFAAWQRRWLAGEVEARQLTYWRRQLADLSPLALPTDRPRPTRSSYRGAAQPFTLSRPATEALRACGQEAGATSFMVLGAAFLALLERLNGQRDIAIGTPIAGRHRSEVEPLIGFFVNTLVLRQRLAPHVPFLTVLQAVRETILDAFAYQDVPFERLVEALSPVRDLGRHPLFQVLFALQSAPEPAPRLAGLSVRALEAGRRAVRFDLELHLWQEAGRLHGLLLYRRDLFDSTTAIRLVASFERLLKEIAADPQRVLGDLPCMAPAQRHQLLVAWSGTPSLRPVSVLRRFSARVKTAAESLAIVDGAAAVSYGALDRRANALAWELRRRGVQPEVRVALLAGRSAETLVAVLAIFKAGAVVVPLDPSHPHRRLARMLEDIWEEGRGMVLLEPALADLLPTRYGRRLALDHRTAPIEKESGPVPGAVSENLAYVVYTSGSSGRPKGVAMTRGALDNLIAWQLAQHAVPMRTLCFAAFGFDIVFQELFATWCSGDTLVLASEATRRDSWLLLALLQRQAVERIFLPVVTLEQLAEVGVAQPLPALRRVITAGEALTITPQVASFFNGRSNVALENHYGPSESHVVTSCLLRPSDSWPRHPPIGRPIAGVEAWVLDSGLDPVPLGCVGELCLAGVALARGYLGQASASSTRFVPCPHGALAGARLYRSGDRARHRADGALEFLGRLDDQVKVRGFRIEPAEVEHALRRHPAVGAATVVAAGETATGRHLVAFLVPRQPDAMAVPAEELRTDRLRAWLLATLPEPMIPSRFAVLSALPLLAHGKVDRRALAAATTTTLPLAQTHVAPRSAVEKEVAAIWREVLGVRRVGVHDDFFALGGHSLLAVRIMARIAAQFAVELPLAVLFEDATVEGLARQIAVRPQSSAGPLIALRRHGTRPPLFLVHPAGGHLLCYRALAEHLSMAQPCFGLEAPGADGYGPFLDTVEVMAASYLEAIRRVQPAGPYQLGGWSMGGVVAYEMAWQLQQEGEGVALLVLIDTAVPRLGRDDRQENETLGLRNFGRDLGLSERILREVVEKGLGALLTAARRRGLVTAEVDAQRLRHLHALFQHHVRASRRYAPRPLGREVPLLHMSAAGRFSVDDSSRRWEALAPGLKRHLVPGDHWTMLREPWVRVVAARLDPYLREAARRAVA